MTKPDPSATWTGADTAEPPNVKAGIEAAQTFDDRLRTVPWLTRTLHRLYDLQAQKVLNAENISIAHWYYLRVLAQSGKVNQLELSRRVGITSTTAVPALDSMEKRGLLERTRDPNDRRKYYVSLTRSGRELVEQMMPGIVDMIDSSLDGIDNEELYILRKVLHQIETNLTTMDNGNAVD